jgi:hypothetical protein
MEAPREVALVTDPKPARRTQNRPSQRCASQLLTARIVHNAPGRGSERPGSNEANSGVCIIHHMHGASHNDDCADPDHQRNPRDEDGDPTCQSASYNRRALEDYNRRCASCDPRNAALEAENESEYNPQFQCQEHNKRLTARPATGLHKAAVSAWSSRGNPSARRILPQLPKSAIAAPRLSLLPPWCRRLCESACQAPACSDPFEWHRFKFDCPRCMKPRCSKPRGANTVGSIPAGCE